MKMHFDQHEIYSVICSSKSLHDLLTLYERQKAIKVGNTFLPLSIGASSTNLVKAFVDSILSLNGDDSDTIFFLWMDLHNSSKMPFGLSSQSMTISLTCIIPVHELLCHLSTFAIPTKYSSDHLCQKCCTRGYASAIILHNDGASVSL